MQNELRIGNWVIDTKLNLIMQITASALFNMVHYRLEFNPIPLTPEILEELGFIKRKKTEYYIVSDKDAGTILIVNVIANEYSLSCFPVAFKYVHQLQNIIHSLTNTELQWNRKQ